MTGSVFHFYADFQIIFGAVQTIGCTLLKAPKQAYKITRCYIWQPSTTTCKQSYYSENNIAAWVEEPVDVKQVEGKTDLVVKILQTELMSLIWQ